MENKKKRVCCLTGPQRLNEKTMPQCQYSKRATASLRKMGWVIVDEQEEAGVSGLRIAKQRDKLQIIQQNALKNSMFCLSTCLTDWGAGMMRHPLS